MPENVSKTIIPLRHFYLPPKNVKKKSFLLHGLVTMKLEQLYYNPKSPAGYAGEQALYKLAKQLSKKVKLQDIRLVKKTTGLYFT